MFTIPDNMGTPERLDVYSAIRRQLGFQLLLPGQCTLPDLGLLETRIGDLSLIEEANPWHMGCGPLG